MLCSESGIFIFLLRKSFLIRLLISFDHHHLHSFRLSSNELKKKTFKDFFSSFIKIGQRFFYLFFFFPPPYIQGSRFTIRPYGTIVFFPADQRETKREKFSRSIHTTLIFNLICHRDPFMNLNGNENEWMNEWKKKSLCVCVIRWNQLIRYRWHKLKWSFFSFSSYYLPVIRICCCHQWMLLIIQVKRNQVSKREREMVKQNDV